MKLPGSDMVPRRSVISFAEGPSHPRSLNIEVSAFHPIADIPQGGHSQSMRIVSAVAWFALAFAAGSGEAHLPPPPGPMKEVGWHGPGHLCEESFTLAVKADEYVREDIQLEPWYPVSNTVKSAAGWYTITQLRDKPKPPKKRALLASSKLGSLYAYPPDDETDAAKFVFLPRRLSARPVEITFWRVDPSDLRYSD